MPNPTAKTLTKPDDFSPAQAAEENRLIYIREVAARYGISTKTVRRLVESNRIPAPLAAKFGNGPCWRKSDIDRHLQELQ